MPGFTYALRYPAGGDVDPPTVELSVPDIRAGERLTLGAGRQVLVLSVVAFDHDTEAGVRALLEVEEL